MKNFLSLLCILSLCFGCDKAYDLNKIESGDITTGKIKPFQFLSSKHIGYIDVERYSIVHDSRDILWISTYGNGLYAYELSTGNLQHFTFEVNQSSHINSNYLQFVIEDRSGGIWVSSEFSGLSHLEILNKGTQRIHPSGENSSDRSNTIRMLFQTQNGNIYMANRMGSLYEYNSALTKVIRQEDFTHNVYSMPKLRMMPKPSPHRHPRAQRSSTRGSSFRDCRVKPDNDRRLSRNWQKYVRTLIPRHFVLVPCYTKFYKTSENEGNNKDLGKIKRNVHNST